MCKIASKGRVDCSASTGPGFYARRGQKKKERWGKESEAYVVYSRKCYIRGPDH